MAKRLSTEDKKANVPPELIAEALSVFEQDTGNVDRASKALNSAKATRSANLKRYEKDGISKALIVQLHEESLLDDDEREQIYADELRYRRAVKLIEWDDKGQGGFLRAMEDAQPADDQAISGIAASRAFNDGFNSALHGTDRPENVHAAGSAEHAAFARGVADGMAQKTGGKPHKKAVKAKDGGPLPKVDPEPQAADEASEASEGGVLTFPVEATTKKKGRKSAADRVAEGLAKTRERLGGEPEAETGLLN